MKNHISLDNLSENSSRGSKSLGEGGSNTKPKEEDVQSGPQILTSTHPLEDEIGPVNPNAPQENGEDNAVEHTAEKQDPDTIPNIGAPLLADKDEVSLDDSLFGGEERRARRIKEEGRGFNNKLIIELEIIPELEKMRQENERRHQKLQDDWKRRDQENERRHQKLQDDWKRRDQELRDDDWKRRDQRLERYFMNVGNPDPEYERRMRRLYAALCVTSLCGAVVGGLAGKALVDNSTEAIENGIVGGFVGSMILFAVGLKLWRAVKNKKAAELIINKEDEANPNQGELPPSEQDLVEKPKSKIAAIESSILKHNLIPEITETISKKLVEANLATALRNRGYSSENNRALLHGFKTNANRKISQELTNPLLQPTYRPRNIINPHNHFGMNSTDASSIVFGVVAAGLCYAASEKYEFFASRWPMQKKIGTALVIGVGAGYGLRYILKNNLFGLQR